VKDIKTEDISNPGKLVRRHPYSAHAWMGAMSLEIDFFASALYG